MRGFIKFWLFLSSLLIVLFIANCNKESYKDHIPPGEVTGLKAEAGNAIIWLTWQDPTDPDFERVEIRYADTMATVPKSIQHYEADHLINDSTYRFTVRAIDSDGNYSSGRHAHAKPVAPPDIAWLTDPSTTMDTSNNGDINGGFTMHRYLQTSGGTGYIAFKINIIRIENDTVVTTYDKNFLVYDNQKYLFEFIARGDISVFNCCDCETGTPTYKAEVICLADNEIFSFAPSSCIEIPPCNNGKSKKETRWNMISVKHLNLFQVTE